MLLYPVFRVPKGPISGFWLTLVMTNFISNTNATNVTKLLVYHVVSVKKLGVLST
jgi:hypothetical protein